MAEVVNKGRIGLYALAILAVGILALLAANAITNGWIYLQLEHARQSHFVPKAAVITMNIASVGKVKMFLNPDDEVITPFMLDHGFWEANETFWFTKTLRKGDTVVDIGANVGYYTLLGAKLVGDKGRIFAFEPDPVSFALMERNIRLNGLTNVVLEQKAVSNEPGSLRLFFNKRNKGDARIYQPKGQKREFVDVEAVALDDYFANYAGRIDYVKIDTQGAEGVILEGMVGLLGKYDGVRMAIEFWPYGLASLGSEPEELVELLTSAGFHFFNLGGVGPPKPMKRLAGDKLLESWPVEGKRHTNLFVTRGEGAPLIRLTDPVP
jgi:FkbM family methyltransferase